MDGVATPIIGRPRPLPGHDTPNPAYHPHTLNYEEPAKAGGAVNGCAYAPFILTVDWLGWVCYLPDKLEFILSYHVLPS